MQTASIIVNEKKKGEDLFFELMKKSSKLKDKRVDIEKIDQQKFEEKKEELVRSLIQKKAKNTMLEFGKRNRLGVERYMETPYFSHLVLKRLPQGVINHYLKVGWDIDLRICKQKGKTTYRYTFTKICHGTGIYTEDVFDEKYERQFECV